MKQIVLTIIIIILLTGCASTSTEKSPNQNADPSRYAHILCGGDFFIENGQLTDTMKKTYESDFSNYENWEQNKKDDFHWYATCVNNTKFWIKSNQIQQLSELEIKTLRNKIHTQRINQNREKEIALNDNYSERYKSSETISELKQYQELTLIACAGDFYYKADGNVNSTYVKMLERQYGPLTDSFNQFTSEEKQQYKNYVTCLSGLFPYLKKNNVTYLDPNQMKQIRALFSSIVKERSETEQQNQINIFTN